MKLSAEYKPAGPTGCLGYIGVGIGAGVLSFGLSVIIGLFFPPFLIIGIIAAILFPVAGLIFGITMGASQIVGPCPHCNRHIGAGQAQLNNNQPGGAFNCPHCKNRVLVTKHSPRFIKPGEPDVLREEEIIAQKEEPENLLDKISIENETKRCPMCAETIKLQAKKCRFCGHLFDVEEV